MSNFLFLKSLEIESNENNYLTTATNQPIKDKKILGKVIDCGLISQAYQND